MVNSVGFAVFYVYKSPNWLSQSWAKRSRFCLFSNSNRLIWYVTLMV